jgi:glycosyltransferase involved in cell wall biosynthesis
MRRYGIAARQPVILTVSRLDSSEKYKGYDTVLKALPAVLQSIPDVRYLIVGKGDDRSRIERIIAESGLESCVTVAGDIADEELCDHYNLCDVFAMPSKGEGFGIVFLEAMACGKPVLAGNKDGSVDALRCGELGVLVDPDNVDEIASALTRMLNATYPHPVIYKPELLRRRVIEAYGYDAFKFTLSNLLQSRLKIDLCGSSSPSRLATLDENK